MFWRSHWVTNMGRLSLLEHEQRPTVWIILGQKADRPGSAGMIIAGYTPKHGGSVYSIPLGGSLHKQSYAIGGSGSTYIYGYCDSYWKENMNEEEGIAFVKGALRVSVSVYSACLARRWLYLLLTGSHKVGRELWWCDKNGGAYEQGSHQTSLSA